MHKYIKKPAPFRGSGQAVPMLLSVSIRGWSGIRGSAYFCDVARRILIIDPQKDFIHPDGNYSSRHRGITQILDAKERINRLLLTQKREELLIITSDYREDQFRQGLSICLPGTE